SGEGSLDLVGAARPDPRIADVRQRHRPARVATIHESDPASQQPGSRGHIAPPPGAPPRPGEELTRARCDRARARVRRVKLDQVAIRLLEVVADDLIVLRVAIAGRAPEPVAEALMQQRALVLRERLVGDVTDE